MNSPPYDVLPVKQMQPLRYSRVTHDQAPLKGLS